MQCPGLVRPPEQLRWTEEQWPPGRILSSWALDAKLIAALIHEAGQLWCCGSPQSLSELAQDSPGVPVLFPNSQKAWELDRSIHSTQELTGQVRRNIPAPGLGAAFRSSISLVVCTCLLHS